MSHLGVIVEPVTGSESTKTRKYVRERYIYMRSERDKERERNTRHACRSVDMVRQ